MALIALGVSWQQGESNLQPGFVTRVAANYSNLGSRAKWNRRRLTAVAPFSPDPHNPTFNKLAPGAWNVVHPSNPGQLDQSVVNAQGVIRFTPAGPSMNLATEAAVASQQSTQAAATKALL